MQMSITLTPNRTTPRTFARMTSYRRNGKKVDRVFISFNRHGKVDRTKAIPINQESKDWSREVAGPRSRAYELVDREAANTIRTFRATEHLIAVEAYLETPKGQAGPFAGLDERTIQVAPTAKRDWLIAMGVLKPDPGFPPWRITLIAVASGHFEVERD